MACRPLRPEDSEICVRACVRARVCVCVRVAREGAVHSSNESDIKMQLKLY
jgi:hypothetical protein